MSGVIHILGGGVAGMAAAIRLSDYGFYPVIIEKTNRLGGRVFSFLDKETGDEIDNGQHLLMSNYKYTNWFLKKINTHTQIHFQKEMNIPYLLKNDDNILIKRKLNIFSLPYPFHFAGIFFKSDIFSFSEKKALLKMFALNRQKAELYSAFTVKEFLRKFKQPESLIKKFWILFVESALNTSIDECSAELLVKTLQQSIIKGGDYCKMGFPLTGLSHIFGKPAENFLNERRVVIEKKNIISKIKFENDKVAALVDKEGKEIPVNFLISTIPFKQLYSILPIQVKDDLWDPEKLEYKYNPIISAVVWTKKPIFHETCLCLLGTNIQWIFNKRVFGGPFNSQHYIYQITISAANKLINEPILYLKKIIKDEIIMMFPQFNVEDLIKIRVLKEKNATPTSNIKNEHYRSFENSSLKNLLIAGDWVQTDLPYTIESSIKSGVIAADKCIDSIFWGDK